MTTAAVERQHEDDEAAALALQNGQQDPQPAPVHGQPDMEPRADPPSLPLPFPEVTEPPADGPPTTAELDARDDVDRWQPPAPAHSFTVNEGEGTLAVHCESTGAEFVMEAQPTEKTTCQGCSFEITLQMVTGLGDGVALAVVERDTTEQAIMAAARDPFSVRVDPELLGKVQREIEEAERAQIDNPDDDPDLIDMARSQQRILADIRDRSVPRAQIGRFAVPVEWVRKQADPGCQICEGEGFIIAKLGQRPEFCSCAKARAVQRVNEHAKAQAAKVEQIDPPESVRTEAEAKRRQKSIDALAKQVRDAEGSLAVRAADHRRQLEEIAAAGRQAMEDLETEDRRQRAAVQDANSAGILAESQAKSLRTRVAEAEQRLEQLRADLALAEVRAVNAVRDAEVAETLAREAGQRLGHVRTEMETEYARLVREFEKRTVGARSDLAKLKRRLALAEARR